MRSITEGLPQRNESFLYAFQILLRIIIDIGADLCYTKEKNDSKML